MVIFNICSTKHKIKDADMIIILASDITRMVFTSNPYPNPNPNPNNNNNNNNNDNNNNNYNN